MSSHESTPAQYSFAGLTNRIVAIAMMVVIGAATIAASPSASPSKPPPASATPFVAINPTQAITSTISHLPDGSMIIGFLSQVIGWYRHLAVEERLVADPAEMLFVAEDRQMADEVLDLSFEFAKAQAALLAATTTGSPPEEGRHRGVPGTGDLTASTAKADADIKAAQDRLKVLQGQLANAAGGNAGT